MKILSKNYKKNFLKVKIENLDDLWYLTYIIDTGDHVKSFTYRKIKLGGEDDRNQKVVKKPAVIEIQVEKIEFSKYSNVLRVSGSITQAPEDIPLGSHHTLNFEIGSELSLQKNAFLKYQIEKIEESAQESKDKILLVVHDREEAYFALLKKYGYEILTHIKGEVQKKTDVKTEVNDFYQMLKKTLLEYDARQNFTRIVIASPGFWREYVQKIIIEDIKKKIIYATCSSVGENGINEVIRRPEVQSALKEERFAEEMVVVEKLLEEISKQGKAEYGLEHVKGAVDAGAVSDLLITDSFIHKLRQEEKFQAVEQIMRKVDSMNGNIHIISAEHEGGNKLDGLGGIAALLRYKLNY